MKLDKIRFAMLVALMSDKGATFSMAELADIDALINIDLPIQYVSCETVDELLRQIMAPDGFIPAIKAYRTLTNAGLKEAKEAIERYRNIPKFPAKDSEPATLEDILGKVNAKERPPVNFDKFEG